MCDEFPYHHTFIILPIKIMNEQIQELIDSLEQARAHLEHYDRAKEGDFSNQTLDDLTRQIDSLRKLKEEEYLDDDDLENLSRLLEDTENTDFVALLEAILTEFEEG